MIQEALDIDKHHLCPDWDYDKIREDSPEFECCVCSRESLDRVYALNKAARYERETENE